MDKGDEALQAVIDKFKSMTDEEYLQVFNDISPKLAEQLFPIVTRTMTDEDKRFSDSVDEIINHLNAAFPGHVSKEIVNESVYIVCDDNDIFESIEYQTLVDKLNFEIVIGRDLARIFFIRE